MSSEPTTSASKTQAWRLVATAYLVTRLPLVLFAYLIAHFGGRPLRYGHFLFHGGQPHTNWLVDAFQKWDAYWFLHIVREGYQFVGPVEQVSGVVAGIPETNVTPFPLYPMLMKAGSWITGDPALAGLVISQVALLIGMWALFRLGRIEFGEAGARRVLWFFALVPWGYAFSAIYSESLFFALTVGAILAVRCDRPGLGGVLGMFAALTRLPGCLVVIPMVLDLHRRRREAGQGVFPAMLWLALVPLGTAAYFAYLWWLTGEPAAYFVAQQGWHKELVPIWHHVADWLTAPRLDGQAMLDIATIAVGLAILVGGWRTLRRSDWTYMAVSFAVLFSSSYLLGLPRYMAGVYPIYLVLGRFASVRPQAGQAVVIAFAMVGPMVFWIWTTWLYAF